MKDTLGIIGLILMILYFLYSGKLANKITDKQRREEAIRKGKVLYIDSKFRVRDTETNCILYRLLLNGKEYYCYNNDCFHPQIHSEIGKRVIKK